MSNQEKEHKSFIFMGRKFILEKHDSTTQKTLSIGKTSQPPFNFLFKFFNPHVQEIYFQKSAYSDYCFIIGHCQYFHTFYFLRGKEQIYFSSKEQAIKYLKKFTKPSFITSKTDKLIWHIGNIRCPMEILTYFANELNFEFKINEYITLRLEKDRTEIYVAGEKFMQCKYLLLSIPKKQIQEYDSIQNIDEAKEQLSDKMEGYKGTKFHIPPIMEFWGHCSNLQAWAENEYCTDIIHSNLAFPLLKKLVEKGDPKANQVFKEEIAYRYENGNEKTRAFLYIQNYLKFLSLEEVITLYQITNDTHLKPYIQTRESQEKLRQESLS